jgi:hypothetical protein
MVNLRKIKAFLSRDITRANMKIYSWLESIEATLLTSSFLFTSVILYDEFEENFFPGLNKIDLKHFT